MLRNVFLKTLRDQRKSLMWWGVGLVTLVIITMLFYPSLKDSSELNNLLGDSDSVARMFLGDVPDITSPEGFLNSQLFFLMVPILFLVFAIGRGSGAIAGEEERGTLDLLLSSPLARSQVVVEKSAAMIVAILVLALVLWLSTAIGAAVVGMDMSFVRMAEATLSVALLGMTFGAIALALGSASGNRGRSIGVAGVLGVVAYFLNAVVPVVEALEPLSKLSPFYYYIGADPLTNGLNFAHAAILIGMTTVLLTIAVVTFDRRDLAV